MQCEQGLRLQTHDHNWDLHYKDPKYGISNGPCSCSPNCGTLQRILYCRKVYGGPQGTACIFSQQMCLVTDLQNLFRIIKNSISLYYISID